jgi:SAM-dependent MidA family methyltransferase
MIRALIAERGVVSFREFMELALYHPEHGYYASGRAALGRRGDYFTSVSVGAVFGELLALQFCEMWERLGRPGDFAMVEQGANDGAFAADVLGWCRERAPDFFAAARYEIVEGVGLVRERQQEKLRKFAGKVTWRTGLEALPPFTGVHFSNELLDAFPVHRLTFRDGEWQELYVSAELRWQAGPLSRPELAAALAGVPQSDGYTTEVSLAAPAWAEQLAGKIERGWVLAMDYGMPRARFYAPERREGTLECYAGHRKGLDPLAEPGSRDLTAHVEFTTAARALMAAGMKIAGYTDQHHFLTGLAASAFAETAPTTAEARQLKTLLHPELLGRSYQALGASRGVGGESLTGFRFARDWRRELEIGPGL